MIRWRNVFAALKDWDPRVLGLVAVVLLDLIAAIFIGRQILVYRDYPFDSDEALHAMRGLRLAFDLKKGDLGAFLRHFYRQSIYPPAGVCLETLAFVVLGPSIVSARLCSLICLVGAIPIIYAIGLKLDEEWGWLIGLVAAGLTLSSRPVLVQAALVMVEMPGVLVGFATLLAYLGTIDRSTPGTLLVTSFLMTLTLLTKYPYGVIILPTIGMAELLAWLSKSPHHCVKARVRRWAWLFLPGAAIIAIWFVGDGKIEDFVYYATLQPKEVDWYSLRNLLFYPRSIALHYSPSPFLAPVMFGGLIWSLSQWDRPHLRLVLLYCFVGLLMVTLKESNNPRFMITVAPAIHLVAGAMVAESIIWTRARVQSMRYLAAIGFLFSLFSLAVVMPALVERFAVFPDLMEVAYETDPRAHELADWIVDRTHGQRLYFVNGWDQFSANAMAWHIATCDTHSYFDSGHLSVPSTRLRLRAFTPERADDFRSQVCFHKTPYVVVFDLGVSSQREWPKYARALSDFLVPVASEEFPLDLYFVDDWLKTNLVTRENLAEAKAQYHFSLQVEATVYRVLDSAPPHSRP